MFRAVGAFEHPARSSAHGFRSHRHRLLLALRKFCRIRANDYCKCEIAEIVENEHLTGDDKARGFCTVMPSDFTASSRWVSPGKSADKEMHDRVQGELKAPQDYGPNFFLISGRKPLSSRFRTAPV